MRGILLSRLTGRPEAEVDVPGVPGLRRLPTPDWGALNAMVARKERRRHEARVQEWLRLARENPAMAAMLVTAGTGFEFQATNQATATAASTPGTSITPGNNTDGSYTTILADSAITTDCYAILIHLTAWSTSAADRPALVTIGIDPAGGTSFTDTILYLLASNAGGADTPGYYYYFPLFIPAGAEIGAKARVDNATVGTGRVHIKVFGRPRRTDALYYGTFVRTFGENIAAGESRGTSVTPANGSMGSYVQLGSSTAEELWWWQGGLGRHGQTAIPQDSMLFDVAVGDATDKELVVEKELVTTRTNETCTKVLSQFDYYNAVPAGANVYGRAATDGAIDGTGGYHMIAYGVGG
jgi:hypothetical protein